MRTQKSSPMDRSVSWLVLPILLFLAFFYAYPVISMLWRSVSDPSVSIEHYRNIFTSSTFLRIFFLSFQIATVVTVVSLILAYPLAYIMATSSPFISRLLLALVLIPFWISILVRSYAWMVLLGREGLVNAVLMKIGIIDAPIRLLNTTFATYVGMVHVLLPFMVLPLFSVLRSIDRRLLMAADGLGARPFTIFRLIIWPLSVPGVIAGSLLVFVLSLGFYVTPALLGSSRDLMIAILIGIHVDLFNWGLASALATVLLLVTLLIVGVFDRFKNIEKILGGKRGL